MEAVSKNLVTTKPLNKLKQTPVLITNLTDYISELKKMLRLPIRTNAVTGIDVRDSHALRSKYGLFTNDSVNLACAMRRGITDVVSHDSDFTRVSGITVWEPTDI